VARRLLPKLGMARTAKGSTVADYMTRSPITIGADQTLSHAHTVMRKNRIRHLPVLHGGKLVGIVSVRDLHLIETLPGVDATEVSVEDAMSTDVYKVPPTASLRNVVREMKKRKLGSAVVTQGNRVQGVFTMIDALSALDDALGRASPARGKKEA
jgi:acetoin utilization protein AcuB